MVPRRLCVSIERILWFQPGLKHRIGRQFRLFLFLFFFIRERSLLRRRRRHIFFPDFSSFPYVSFSLCSSDEHPNDMMTFPYLHDLFYPASNHMHHTLIVRSRLPMHFKPDIRALFGRRVGSYKELQKKVLDSGGKVSFHFLRFKRRLCFGCWRWWAS